MRTIVTFALTCLLVLPAAAQAPSVINYQARLTDNSPGQTPVDATLAVDFRIYGSPTGSDLVWSESWPALPVVGGLLNVMLGSNGSPLDLSVFSATGPRWLEVEIDGEILAPRQRMGSVAYAQSSASADDVSIVCGDGQLLKYVGGEWSCSDPTTCPAGTTVECYSGPAGTLDVGACIRGSATCNGAGYETCSGQVVPQAETCDGDDNDCDGQADETFPEQFTPCTSGVGACETGGELVCPKGVLECNAVPGDPQAETCNGIDDDCNGVPDDNVPADGLEPNDSCGATTFIGTLGSDQLQTVTTSSIYPSGDSDHYRVNLVETDSSCGCGGFPNNDEGYRFHATLNAPAGAGPYQVCVGTGTCGAFSCTTVGGGSGGSVFVELNDGSCSQTESYTGYVRVQGLSPSAFDCETYALTVRFESGFCPGP